MKCPKCGSEVGDSAKFCKKCGASLTAPVFENNNNGASKSNKNMKMIIVALIIITVVLSGALIYFYGFSHVNQSDDSQSVNNSSAVANVTSQPQQTQNVQSSQAAANSMTIYGGSFETGSSLSDKTYASIYVGTQHAGEKVKIQILYSRDGNSLNNGNMVSKTVDSDGYINVKSAEPYKYYPDFATINIYDTSGNLLDTQSVSLTPDSGIQSF